MTLTADQTAYFKRKLGSGVDLVDLEARLVRLEADEDAVIVEVREERYNTTLQKPASFTIPGEYSENRAANLEAMRKDGGSAGSVVTIVPTDPPGYGCVALDTEELFQRQRSGYRGGR